MAGSDGHPVESGRGTNGSCGQSNLTITGLTDWGMRTGGFEQGTSLHGEKVCGGGGVDVCVAGKKVRRR